MTVRDVSVHREEQRSIRQGRAVREVHLSSMTNERMPRLLGAEKSSATSSAANAVRPRRGTRGWSVTYSSCWQALVSLQLLLRPRPSWPAPRCWPR